MADMEVDTPADVAPPSGGASKKKSDGKDKKRFEVKKVCTPSMYSVLGIGVLVSLG